MPVEQQEVRKALLVSMDTSHTEILRDISELLAAFTIASEAQ